MAFLEPLRCRQVGTLRIALMPLNTQWLDENHRAKLRYGNVCNLFHVKIVFFLMK